MNVHRAGRAMSLILLCVLMGNSLVLADVMPPGFDDPANNPTRQKWLPQPPGPAPAPGDPLPPPEPLPGELFPPTEDENPYGEGSISLGEGWESEWVNPPGSNPGDPVEPIPTWHYDESIVGGNGTLTITIPNSPDPNPLKYLWYRIIADKSPSDAAREPSVDTTYDPPVPPEDVSVSPVTSASVSEQLGGSTPDGGVWYKYEGMYQITPNPQSETITFEILHCTNIAEVEVRTVCMVPEPTTLAVLATGGVIGLLRRHRR